MEVSFDQISLRNNDEFFCVTWKNFVDLLIKSQLNTFTCDLISSRSFSYTFTNVQTTFASVRHTANAFLIETPSLSPEIICHRSP